MCGITGIISTKSFSSSIIKAMNDKISHRGPDEEGFLLGGDITRETSLYKENVIDSALPLAFGHRRLSIVDLSPLGHQPMSYLDKYWIVYNGEVYNHIELRAELEENGYQFVSHTDTEVIMAAYDFWGKDCLNKFNGMWAFVLFDIENNELFISRDRFGKKPLYYYQDQDHFIFSSEMKAILAHPAVTAIRNQAFCDAYLKDGCVEYTRDTAFQNIYRFDFTSYYQCKLEDIFKPIKEQKFWKVIPNLSNEEFNQNKADKLAQQYYDLLSDAVKLRLRADVKVGSASSGGLDSSSIVYLINQQLRADGKEEKQETFSTVYKTPGTEHCDESEFINQITSELNVVSNQIEPKEDEVIKEHSGVIYALENPPERTLMSSWHTFKLVASTDVTVTLDGQGADEQMAGYLDYIVHYCTNKNLRSLFKEYKYFKSTNTQKFFTAGILFNLSGKVIGKGLTNQIARKFFNVKQDYFLHLNERLHADTFTSLITLIHFADHTSMAHSIESRMPFMDYRLIEFLSSVPVCYKIHNGWTKYIARLAFDKKLPDTITWRKDKMGWPIPEDKWFNGTLKDWYLERVRDGYKVAEQKIPDDISSLNKIKAIRYLNLSVNNEIFFK